MLEHSELWKNVSTSICNREHSMGDEPRLTVAPHFPVVREECKEVAARFFHCFTVNAKMQDKNDTVGNRPILACSEEMKKYDDCMVVALEKRRNPNRTNERK